MSSIRVKRFREHDSSMKGKDIFIIKEKLSSKNYDLWINTYHKYLFLRLFQSKTINGIYLTYSAFLSFIALFLLYWNSSLKDLAKKIAITIENHHQYIKPYRQNLMKFFKLKRLSFFYCRKGNNWFRSDSNEPLKGLWKK